MIHVEISVEPYFQECRWIEPLVYDPETPPHIIISRQFRTWNEVRRFLTVDLDLKSHNDELGALLEGDIDEYVGVEIELMERTEKLYTKSCLAIEGEAE